MLDRHLRALATAVPTWDAERPVEGVFRCACNVIQRGCWRHHSASH